MWITVLPKDSKWTGRVDSHGFRILQDQVVNVQQLTQEEILLILKNSIIHEDGIYVVLLLLLIISTFTSVALTSNLDNIPSMTFISDKCPW